MGKVKYLEKLRQLLKGAIVFRARDVELIVKNKNYTNLLLHNLVKRGEIKRVTKGWYSFLEDPIVSVFCFKPAYIGLQEALSFYNLWEQETNVVIITIRKVRSGVRKIFGNNVIIRRIKPEFFFGVESLRYNEFFVPTSDLEKTLIDLIYFNEIPDKKVLREMKKRIDKKKLESYLKKYPKKFKERVRKVLGLLKI